MKKIMLLLKKEDIKRIFSMKEAISANKEAFRAFTSGKAVVPIRVQISADKTNGTFVCMPAYFEPLDCATLKIVNVFSNNVEKGFPVTQGVIILMDGKTGSILALMDGTYVTVIRTGAASGAAFDLLARKDACKGALFGTGGQAAAQLEAMLVSRHLEVVKVYSRNPEHVRVFVERMQHELKRYMTRIIAAASADDAVIDADMIVCATNSASPVFDGKKVKKGATISGIGSYQPHMQELDAVLLQRADKIFFDSKDAVLQESGDIIIPLRDGMITEHSFTGELGALITGQVEGRTSDEEIIIFKSVGIGIQDLISANFIYKKAIVGKIGVTLEIN
jgi:ornithine cyclodeaminase